MSFRTKKISQLLPHSKGERALLAFLIFWIPFLAAWMFLVVLPEQGVGGGIPLVAHALVLILVVYNVAMNFAMVVRVQAAGDEALLPVILKPGWQYCHYCQLNSPPRSYHCDDCRACILRRDHHCRFTGCCIGHHNQRYFIVAVLYAGLGLTYGLWYHWPLLWRETEVTSPLMRALVLLVPHFCWLFGVITTWGLVVCSIHSSGVAAWVLCAYVFWTQLRVLLTGRTQWEEREGVLCYGGTRLHNVRMVLGSRWYLVFLSPHIASPLPSDGMSFPTPLVNETTKDL